MHWWKYVTVIEVSLEVWLKNKIRILRSILSRRRSNLIQNLGPKFWNFDRNIDFWSKILIFVWWDGLRVFSWWASLFNTGRQVWKFLWNFMTYCKFFNFLKILNFGEIPIFEFLYFQYAEFLRLCFQNISWMENDVIENRERRREWATKQSLLFTTVYFLVP